MANWRSVAKTDVGQRRDNNEDAFFRDDELGLYIVADGMGGYAAGEVASAEAVATIATVVRNKPDVIRQYVETPSKQTEGNVRRLIHSAISGATYMVYSISQDDEGRKGMGTTISTMLVAGGVIFIGQVGDSRVYLFRQGRVFQLTEDHSYVNYQVKKGLMTPEEAKTSPQRNLVTRSVGRHDHVQVDTFVYETRPGDRFLLSSDGLHDYAIEHKQLIPFATMPDMQDAAAALVAWANQSGGKDNITAVLAQRD